MATPDLELLQGTLDLQQVIPGSGCLVARSMSDAFARVTRSWRLGATMFVVFGGLAVASCWLPARRASRVDPASALRGE